MTISFIICLETPFCIYQSAIQFFYQQFLKYIFESGFQKSISICDTADAVFCNNLSYLFFCYDHKKTPFWYELSYLNSYQKGVFFSKNAIFFTLPKENKPAFLIKTDDFNLMD